MHPKIKKALRDPYFACSLLLDRMGRFVNDENFVKWSYFLTFHRKLNLENPQTFNEKLQWLKLYDRREEYTQMVDKYEAKKHVASIIGEEYIIPTLGIYDTFEEIDFNKLPNQYVLKCTHDSGGVAICKDKATFDVKAARKLLSRNLKRNKYWSCREYPYKNIKPRLIIEKYMEDANQKDLIDYKIMCFNGKAQMIFTCTERYSGGLKVTFFDLDWNKMPFERHYPSSDKVIEKPKCLQKMIDLSEKLSQGISFVRMDWYEINGKIYFGEYTFYPGSGYEEFTPEEWDYKLGQYLHLPLN